MVSAISVLDDSVGMYGSLRGDILHPSALYHTTVGYAATISYIHQCK